MSRAAIMTANQYRSVLDKLGLTQAIAGKDERAAKRWLAGEFEPPPAVFLAIFAECLKREGE